MKASDLIGLLNFVINTDGDLEVGHHYAGKMGAKDISMTFEHLSISTDINGDKVITLCSNEPK
jgi:hypothetical protein